MKRALKNHFIPHEGNNYHPHALHLKRFFLYGGLLAAIKVAVFAFAIVLPIEAYLAPDVMGVQTQRIVALTNQIRAGKGLSTLTVASPLERSAELKAADMADNGYFAHTGPNGHNLVYFLGQVGYKYSIAGENLAVGFSDAESIVDAWVKSPTHYANLVKPSYTEFGIGFDEGAYEGQETLFVAQHFGTPFVMQGSDSSDIQKVVGSSNNNAPTQSTNVGAQGSAPIPASTPTPAPIARSIATTIPTETTRAQNPAPLRDDANTTDSNTQHTLEPVQLSELAPTSDSPDIKEDTQPDVLAVTLPNEDTARPATLEQTPWQKYTQARNWFSVVPSVFSVSHWVFFAFLAFFAIVLGIAIFIELHKQKPHVILRTMGLMAFIFMLWKI